MKHDLWGALRVALEKSLRPPTDVSRGCITVRKGLDGSYNLVGKFSNRWRDTDFHSNPLNGGEIVTNAAHEEFSKWLDKNPQHALELWSWHRWGTARKSRANWWGYSGNSFYMNWPLTEEEAKAVSSWMLDNEPGMSFGFYVFGYDGEKGLIDKYRAFEASILPKQYAANPWASFQLHSQENDMAFSTEQRKALVTLHGESFVKQLEQTDAEQAALLDKAGVETKEAAADAGEATQTTETAAVEPSDLATQKDVVAALQRMEEAYSAALKTLADKVEVLEAELGSFKTAAANEAKAAAAPLSILAAYLPKSILDQPKTTETEVPAKSTAQISGNSSLARSVPKGSAPARQRAALTLADLPAAGGNK